MQQSVDQTQPDLQIQRGVYQGSEELYTAAGVLPFCWIRGKPYVLLGAEVPYNNPTLKNKSNYYWRDFGGKREESDTDSIHTAAREFAEETLGVFAGLQVTPQNVEKSCKIIYDQIRSDGTSLKVVHKLKRGEYHMYITHVDYIDPFMFYCAVEQNIECKALPQAEKIGFSWVPINTLLKLIKKKKKQTKNKQKSSTNQIKSRKIRIFLPPGLNSMRLRCKDSSAILLHPCFRTSLVRVGRGGKLRRFLKQQQTVNLTSEIQENLFDDEKENKIGSESVDCNHQHLLYWVQLINQSD
eukprot:TRINITY_DN5519_c1_g1_i1.p2 TRINITY_DN5519_c1_g1~~TRINITY_DN5519_c1_g1_i1.p2  ORF type:complete len:297 (+),score=40.06 TRINITY_DN5519_c1_g1_i1:11-901(+)